MKKYKVKRTKLIRKKTESSKNFYFDDYEVGYQWESIVAANSKQEAVLSYWYSNFSHVFKAAFVIPLDGTKFKIGIIFNCKVSPSLSLYYDTKFSTFTIMIVEATNDE